MARPPVWIALLLARAAAAHISPSLSRVEYDHATDESWRVMGNPFIHVMAVNSSRLTKNVWPLDYQLLHKENTHQTRDFKSEFGFHDEYKSTINGPDIVFVPLDENNKIITKTMTIELFKDTIMKVHQQDSNNFCVASIAGRFRDQKSSPDFQFKQNHPQLTFFEVNGDVHDKHFRMQSFETKKESRLYITHSHKSGFNDGLKIIKDGFMNITFDFALNQIYHIDDSDWVTREKIGNGDLYELYDALNKSDFGDKYYNYPVEEKSIFHSMCTTSKNNSYGCTSQKGKCPMNKMKMLNYQGVFYRFKGSSKQYLQDAGGTCSPSSVNCDDTFYQNACPKTCSEQFDNCCLDSYDRYSSPNSDRCEVQIDLDGKNNPDAVSILEQNDYKCSDHIAVHYYPLTIEAQKKLEARFKFPPAGDYDAPRPDYTEWHNWGPVALVSTLTGTAVAGVLYVAQALRRRFAGGQATVTGMTYSFL